MAAVRRADAGAVVRLMVAYALVAQLTDTSIPSVDLKAVTVGWRHLQNKVEGDLVLTDAMKEGILAAANYSRTFFWDVADLTG